ncbi:DUF721 domain-containing protein [uncultured Duncaniella sp.]|jgi:predicted nucleic acid-binding Zn ribbon protein|uniref:DUF721 domain-containing protein n=1 Tax=uncultured Duncaniella sp. TaxID=2768039 RepID=UPI0026769DBE|nr:DUF721 domain-containing protein [uncultured Duncaniella sp.]MCI9173001.1 DUF721 domain-containing protein [Muribaculaceae bacterium]
MKRTYPKHIAAIIDEAMDRAGLTDSLNEQRAAAAWVDVVGPSINRYTTRRYVDHGVMHVYMTSAPLKNELGFVRDRLIEAINRQVGVETVKEIVFH